MTRRKTILCAVLVTLIPLAAHAEHTRFWRQSDYDDFQRGTATGVAVRSDGKITPAPRFDSFADPSMSFLWSLRLDAQGRLYAAGGSDAKVLRFDSAGKSTTVFESSELAAQAITFDLKGNLYVGTSPDGKVYKVTPDGAKSVFFDPKAKYIWALAADPQGDVFVGTGDKGEIFVVPPDGNGKSFYQSDQRHARALAFDSKGNLLVGTEPDGLILRIPITRKNSAAAPEAGAPFVLYETNEKEVTSLLPDASGNIYAAAIGEKTRSSNAPIPPAAAQPVIQAPPSPSAPTAQVSASASSAQAQTVIVQPGIPASYLGASATGAEIVQIAADDSPELLWSSRDEIVLSLGLSADGKLLLGTGNRGEIVRLEGNGVYSDIEQTSAMQVTSLVAAPDGKIYAASANPGKVFVLGLDFQPDGNFVSTTYDASIFSRWGRLTWWGEDGGAQGRVAFYVRSGNTSNPEKNWSDWTGPYKSASGDTVTCPAARFVQWKAVFLEDDSGGQPSISWVSLAFQPKNVAPVIDAVALQDPGVRVAGFAQQGGQSNTAPVQLHIPERAGADTSGQSGDAEASARQARIEIPPQAVQDRGYQSVLWSAHDDNDDALTFSIYYRGEGEKNWRLLKDKIPDQYYSWDTATMPDGPYYLRIIASDAPSNPPNEALTDERESDRFLVGNTPPRVEDLRAQATSRSATLSFGATSTSGAIARASYSLDSADWQIVFPVGQLTDAPKEEYKWDIANLSPGEHTVSVRVTDRFGNETAAKTTFTVSPSSAPAATSASAAH
jgi:hypothetical protein